MMPNQLSSTRRFPAEWEPQSAVQLTFPHAETDWADILDDVLPVFVEIVRQISRFQDVLVVCRNTRDTARMLADIDASRIILAACDSNDTWARDHGGLTVFEGDMPVLLDFQFNGWGLKFPADKDNLITRCLHAQGVFNGRIDHGGMVLEGGGIESDGQGTLMVTSACLLSPNRNPQWGQAEIENRLKILFGAERVLWLHYGGLAGDDTDAHIDTLARFCQPDCIAYVQCDNPADDHFEVLQKMESELRTFATADGKPYRLVPLPWPDACYAADGHRLPATYANFLIINGAVLVPTYRVRQDEAALQVIQSIFPDHEVIGVDCRALIEQHGSLHCITMQYPAGVVHKPADGEANLGK